ncbi:MAG TPA: hypothetical protein PKE39_05715 [Ignavibacteria bacterium]|nr:hypothetical protein [Ignavibacteria bacterium]HMQ98501.1 hypothetical protein [Ignavibacteria bacterium]
MDVSLKILMFASDPAEGKKLNIPGEVKAIESAINESPLRGSAELKVVWNTGYEDILFEICRYHPRIVHFSGRSTNRGLILHGGNSKSRLLDFGRFAKILNAVKEEVELLFLNSCFSSARSKTIVNEIEHLISLKGYADDKAAVMFPGFFYRYLFCGYSPWKSMELAKTELLLRKIKAGYEPEYAAKCRDNIWQLYNENSIK